MPATVDASVGQALQNVAPFRVWIRPLGTEWKLRVDGEYAAYWLADQLFSNGVNSTEPMDVEGNGHFTFRSLTETKSERNLVESLLVKWPEVRLQNSPDDGSTRAPTVRTFEESSQVPLSEPVQYVPDELNPFRVWTRPMGNMWKIRVEGESEAGWLRTEFVQRGLDCTDSIDVSGTGMFVFRCMSLTPHQKDYIECLLIELPQVKLQNDPA